MNRIIQALNFLGVVVLIGLCVAQWRQDGRLNRRVIDLEQTRLDLLSQVSARDQRIKEDAQDLDDFRRRVALAEGQLTDLQTKLTAKSQQCDQLAADRKLLLTQRDQLKAALSTWIAAVAARDAALKHAGDELKKLAADRDGLVQQYNDLANKYNVVVKQLNDERAAKQ